jgi:hypothetical protein
LILSKVKNVRKVVISSRILPVAKTYLERCRNLAAGILPVPGFIIGLTEAVYTYSLVELMFLDRIQTLPVEGLNLLTSS